MNKKIDIREIHTNFEHLLFERDELISSDLNSPRIDQLDKQLLKIIISGINTEIAFSKRMNLWKPNSVLLSESIENEFVIDAGDKKITVSEALARKIDKERKFKSVQNWSMLVCTFLLVLYYLIVGWWI